jgi:glutaredoxin 3
MSFLRRFFSTGPTLTMEAAQKKAQAMIDNNAVMVFSKSYCPYCRNTKRILDTHGAKYHHYELNQEGLSD